MPSNAESTAGSGLHVKDVSVSFRGVKALTDVNLSLTGHEILGLIGPNGAGKTTLVNVASGFQPPTSGDLVVDGTRMTGRAPARYTRAGLARTFQAVRPFSRMTVRENLQVGALAARRSRPVESGWISDLLERFGLADLADAEAGSISYGQQRRLGIARAVAARPRYLLLDEPAAGLNEGEGEELQATLREIPTAFACAVLLIEHDMPLVMRVCDRIQVLDHGVTLAVGTPDEALADQAVRDAYLGAETAL